jgi:transcriptional regulator with XRE-family HTH domain
MPRLKPSEEDLQERESRKQEWRRFRKENLLTQIRLAEVLGISRRTVQLIEAGRVTPFPGTLRKFLALKAKYEHERDFDEDPSHAL